MASEKPKVTLKFMVGDDGWTTYAFFPANERPGDEPVVFLRVLTEMTDPEFHQDIIDAVGAWQTRTDLIVMRDNAMPSRMFEVDIRKAKE
jgi:hypothetical protein